MSVVYARDVEVKALEINVVKRSGDLVEVGHWRAHLHVPRLIQGIKSMTCLTQVVRVDLTIVVFYSGLHHVVGTGARPERGHQLLALLLGQVPPVTPL